MVQVGNALPASFIVDPSAEFQPGQCAELTVIGNQVMVTVSNGTAPLGIIDDVKTKSFSSVAWNEEVIISCTNPALSGSTLVLPVDSKAELVHAYVASSSFQSTVKVQLIPTNGVIVFLAGTPLNFDLTGSGTPNAVRTVVNYTYQVPNISMDDIDHYFYPFTVDYSSVKTSFDPDPPDVSLAKVIIHKHGGTINVTQEEAHRIKLIITLPLL